MKFLSTVLSPALCTLSLGLAFSASVDVVQAQDASLIAPSLTPIGNIGPAGQLDARAGWEAALRQRLFPGANPGVALPARYQLFQAGELGLALDVDNAGVKVVSLYDLARQRELLAAQNTPLFTVTLRTPGRTEGPDKIDGTVVSADAGWKSVAVQRNKNGFALTFWRDDVGGPLTVEARATFEPRESAVAWDIVVRKPASGGAAGATPVTWSVTSVTFPQVTLSDLGPTMRAFVPRGAGKVFTAPFEQKLEYKDIYGNGSCTMQFLAAYDEGVSGTGLYVAREDPTAAHKRIQAVADGETRTVRLAYEQPAENPLTPGNGFELTGKGVWKLLHGDWYDAAQRYKSFVQAKANWWPRLTNNGREDTPLWYRQLDAWNCLASKPEEAQADTLQFQQELGVPIGLHWYLWHTIPFDNDYPHYFPAVPGFRETMRTLQKAGNRVIPYMNGRLWDTRDKGMEDWQYTKVALPSTAKIYKDGKLTPQTENYFGKEPDGSDIYLGVMCPTTKLWQDTMSNLVTKMTREEGSDGIYLDQIGAVGAVECMDPTHGHPLGGGHWWVDGYHKLLGRMRKEMRPGTIVTTECNAEPYVKYMDGYLTLHWQDNGQVPAFPAIYGGAVQMFGRLYTGLTNLNVRMKSGQQLVYGEQIGWLREDLHMKLLDARTRDYFRDVVKVRSRIHEYMYAGEMARPPRFDEKLPTVTADWNYGSGEVTTDAVLTGAWKKRGAKKMILLFTNVSDQPVNANFTFRPEEYGVSQRYRVVRWNNTDLAAKTPPPALARESAQRQTLNLPPASTQVWEVQWN